MTDLLTTKQLADIRERRNAGRKPKEKWITGSTIGEILDEAETDYKNCGKLLEHTTALEETITHQTNSLDMAARHNEELQAALKQEQE